jgi:fructoselysine 6-kinase
VRAAVIGDNCIDVYRDLDVCYPTGNAVDTGVHLQKLGLATSFVGFTGTDAYSDWIVETLRAEGLDTSYLLRMDGPAAIAELGMDGVECLHQHYTEGVQAWEVYTPQQLAFAAGHDLIHSTPWAHLDEHLPALRAGSARLSFDYSDRWSDAAAQETMRYVQIGFFSMGGAADAAADVLREAVGRGLRLAVATLGPNGSIAWDGAEFTRCDAVRAAKVVNTVGAGDSFIAAFLTAELAGRPVAECLHAGAVLAAQVVGHFGPWDPIPLRPPLPQGPQP